MLITNDSCDIWAENVHFPGNTIMFQQTAPLDCFHALILHLCTIIYHVSLQVINLLAVDSCLLIESIVSIPKMLTSRASQHPIFFVLCTSFHPAGRSDLGIHSDIINMYSCAFEWAETKLKWGWHRGRVSIQHSTEQQRRSCTSVSVQERPSEWKQHRVRRSHQET